MKLDTPKNIAADLRELATDMYNDGYITPQIRDALKSKLDLFATRIETVRPGPLKRWYRQFFREDGKWYGHPMAYEMSSKPKNKNGVVWRPFDPDDKGPNHE